ncbi:MAG: trk/ktr system potassium uptake protein [Clostridia bacterium]|nr:trk/ktr system potassium uptake protein [Clostridia bacterium]
MRIVVIGAGKVGFKLSEILSYSGHDVLIIEQNPDRIAAIEDKLDVQIVCASCLDQYLV